MLLYDRVYEAAVRADASCLRAGFKDLPCYELSSLIGLFNDYERESQKPIPKTAPHPSMWCEWEDTDEDGTVEMSGCWIRQWDAEFLRQELAKAFETWVPGKFDIAYSCTGFGLLKYHKDAKNNAIIRNNLNNPVIFNVAGGLWTNENNTDFVTAVWENDPTTFANSFGLPCLKENTDSAGGMFWPPFLSFMLLHCKNIVTEIHAPDEKLQRRLQKTGTPPRVTYKTLRVEVPKSVHVRQSYGEGDEVGPRVRFHLCSGHFKNLRHDRYKEKGWHWWPAHWRGSKELGEVHKRYELTRGTNA